MLSLVNLLSGLFLQTGDQSGDFDYYLMQLSYVPEFCRLHPDQKDSHECSGGFNFVLHGLWPQWTIARHSGSYPEFCQTKYKCDVQSILAQIPEWSEVAPEYDTLAKHEWERHGSCSGLDPLSYFQLAIKLASSPIQKLSKLTDLKDIQSLLPMCELVMDSSKTLSGINLYFSKVGQLISKPS